MALPSRVTFLNPGPQLSLHTDWGISENIAGHCIICSDKDNCCPRGAFAEKDPIFTFNPRPFGKFQMLRMSYSASIVCLQSKLLLSFTTIFFRKVLSCHGKNTIPWWFSYGCIWSSWSLISWRLWKFKELKQCPNLGRCYPWCSCECSSEISLFTIVIRYMISVTKSVWHCPNSNMG